MKIVQFGSATVSPRLKEGQPEEAAKIEEALKKPANKAMVDLLETLNADEGGTHVVFYDEAAVIGDAFLMTDAVVQGPIRADVVTGSGDKSRTLRSAIAPDARSKSGSLWDKLFGGEIDLNDFVAKALAEAFKEGSVAENIKAEKAKKK